MAYRFRGLGATTSDLIAASAARYGVPPQIAVSVAKKESGFNQNAVGTSGERGVFQIMPGTARDLGIDPTDLSQNIDGGVRYLSQMYSQFGDWNLALQAYNGGPGNVQRGTVSSAAQSYADSILGTVSFDGEPAPEQSYTASILDSFSFGDGPSPGLSGTVMIALGIAAAGLMWAAKD